MGKKSLPNDGISMASLGKLFATGDIEEDEDDQLVQTVLDAETANDPWLSDPPEEEDGNPSKKVTSSKKSSYTGDVQLHRRIVNSTPIRKALTERKSALEEGRILTIPFRSVEDYLAKLQLTSEACEIARRLLSSIWLRLFPTFMCH